MRKPRKNCRQMAQNLGRDSRVADRANEEERKRNRLKLACREKRPE